MFRKLYVGMVKSMMEQMDVYVLLVLIGMVNGVNLTHVMEEDNGMVQDVPVNLVKIIMDPCVCYVLMVNNGIQEVDHVNVQVAISGMEISVRKFLHVLEAVSIMKQ